jgi:hypothetical protein
MTITATSDNQILKSNAQLGNWATDLRRRAPYRGAV